MRYAADLHQRALPHGFFVELGGRFLTRYWRAFAEGPRATVLIATRDGQPLGALCGTTANRGHFAWTLRNHGLALALWGLLALIRRPGLGWRFVRTRGRRYLRNLVRLVRHRLGRSPERSSGGADQQGRRTPPPPVAVLMHMMVEPSARGTGVGRALVSAFAERAQEDGAQEARLVTLSGERGASGFYEKLDWEVDRHLPAGPVREARTAMRRDLDPGGGAGQGRP